MLKRNTAAVFLLICAAQIFAQGQKEVTGKPQNKTVTVSGTIRIVGSSPFAELVLTDADDKDWYFFDDEGTSLKVYQKKQITVTGTPVYEEIILPNGKKNGIKRYLKNVKIADK
ncbi:MAG: hypothetical protein Ta2B_29270 [Termitinemataceae bacterium]|nr:MAG: hypothetical protein Ta2B_29270 [Termitinemataceae bacterium]